MTSDTMSEQDREVQERARRFVDEELIPWEQHAEEHDGHIPEDVRESHHRTAIELGLSAMNMPAELGGGGMSTFRQVLVSEQIGRVTNALGWCVFTPPAWAPRVVSLEQLGRWIVPTIRGERHECYAITEAGAGSDVDAIEATARRDGGDYVLAGEKMHVTSYGTADYLFFQAKIAGGPNDGTHAMFFVDKDTPGVRLVREPRYTHTYPDTHAVVAFDDVRVPATNLIGAEGEGLDFTYEWFRYERLMIAARSCGAAERLIEEATAFAKERVQFGRPIIEFQAIQHMLADSLTELWAARLMTYELARNVDRGVDVKVQHAQCSMAKLYASEMAGRVADRAVQIFGGRGYMRENVAERFYREVRVDRIWEGTSEVQRNIVGDQLAKRGVRALIG
ncbi:MAG TPA: acyl-CoA dehydrogenase family protein [Actinomycetota bacterium]|jgi:alkylation response protein AidB-like acyl-CoA dehydrogenase|nr:acyl-CoA dehydrogenase family protein [Actinomycetota bacterium]